MGLNDEDQRELENEIINNPKTGAVVRGTGGLRKMRYALKGRGKSGGVRVLYVDYVIFERSYLIYAYTKGVKDDITDSEREQFRKLIEQTRNALGGDRYE